MNIETHTQQAQSLATLGLPTAPYRGIESFRLVDRPIFRARDRDVRSIFRLSSIYRAIIVSGDSGVGKSSLLNAGLIPALVEDGSWVERMRVQPIANKEFFVERLSLGDDGHHPFLPSIFAPDDLHQAKLSISASELVSRLRAALGTEQRSPTHPPIVLLCDQFEESVTLFEEAPESREAFHQSMSFQRAMFEALAELITDDELNVKLIFALRDDYLPKVQRHFERFYPQIKSQVHHLDQLTEADLTSIIEGPYKARTRNDQPLFTRRLNEQTCHTLEAGLRAKSDNGYITLTGTQIACRTLWDEPKEEALFNTASEKANPASAVQHLYDQHMENSMKPLSDQEQRHAKLALTKLITSSGTRNIVSRDDLFRTLADENISEQDAETTMATLTGRTRLVYLQARGETPFYEIVSESLIPWIQEQAAVFQEEKRQAEEAEKRLAKIAADKVAEKEQAERRRIQQAEADKAEMRLASYRKNYKRALLITAGVGVLLAILLWWVVGQARQANNDVIATSALLATKQSELSGLQQQAEEQRKASEADVIRRQETIDKLTSDLESLRSIAASAEAKSNDYQREKATLEAAITQLKTQLTQRTDGESKAVLAGLNKLQLAADISGTQLQAAQTGIAKVSNTIADLEWRTGHAQVWGGPGNSGGFGSTLAFITTWQQADATGVFRPDANRSRPPSADAFDPSKFYIAARWDYTKTPADWLRQNKVKVRNPKNPKVEFEAQPVEWGPPEKTGDLMAISPGLANALGVTRLEDVSYLNPTPLEKSFGSRANPALSTSTAQTIYTMEGINDGRTRSVPSKPNWYVWVGKLNSKNQRKVDFRVFSSTATPASYYTESEIDSKISALAGGTKLKEGSIGKDSAVSFSAGGKNYQLVVTDLSTGLLKNDHVDLKLIEK